MARLRYRKLSTVQRKVAFDAIKFAIKKFTPRLYTKLDIMVKGDGTLVDKEGIRGDVEWIDQSDKPREFVIRLDTTMEMKDFLQTLFHEMVHVKQYAKGEFKELATNVNVFRWNGKRIDITKVDYWDQPWEIEALGREEGLYYQFLDEHPAWKEFIC